MPDHATDADQTQVEHQRLELLRHLDALTAAPLVALSFVWLLLLILDLTVGLHPWLQTLSTVIWVLFGLDFLVGFLIAPRKGEYLRHNWLTVISLLLPALRVLRLFRALRLLRAARAVRSINLLRLLTSLNRGMRAVTATIGRRGVGYVVALTVIVTFAGAAGMAFFESPAAVDDGGLGNYGEALWWTAMIMTTMGSDYWPRTVEGRILAWLLSVYAFAIFGYITATIASYFFERDAAAAAPADASRTRSSADAAALQAELAALRRQVAALTERLDGRSSSSSLQDEEQAL